MIWDEGKDNIFQWDLYENKYMAQPKGFVVKRKNEQMGCHL
jgi:hypothetical protein